MSEAAEKADCSPASRARSDESFNICGVSDSFSDIPEAL